MVFPILGANSDTGAYEIENSCRFSSAGSEYMHRTPAADGAGSGQKWTISFWVKRWRLYPSSEDYLINAAASSGQQGLLVKFQTAATNKLEVSTHNS